MSRSTLASSWLLLGALLASCAPMTFSKPASVDFEAYPSVQLELGGPDGAERQFDYLENELRTHSGFQRVTRDRREAVSARLEVELTLGFSIVSSEEDTQIEYFGSASYRLIAADAHLVDSGIESAVEEDTSFEAAESALDLVVYHYLRQYRL